MEKAIIDLSYQDFFKEAFYEGIKGAGTDAMIDPYNLQVAVMNAKANLGQDIGMNMAPGADAKRYDELKSKSDERSRKYN